MNADLLNGILVFFIGSLIGSFLNVVIYRLPRESSIVWPGSGCPKCNKEISWYDNIPVLSWLMLGGKCRNCSEPISARYPLIEIITAGLFLLIYMNFGINWQWFFLTYFICVLIVICWIDIDHMLILNSLTYPAILAGLVFSYLNGNLQSGVLGAVTGAVLFLLIAKGSLFLMKKEGMGMGDVTLVTLLGAWLGLNYLLGSLVISFFLGSVIGVILYMVKGKSDYFPFGPFLVTGALLTLFTDNFLLNFYLNKFL